MTDTAALIERLTHSIETAVMDNETEPGSDAHHRHAERLEAMADAKEVLSHLTIPYGQEHEDMKRAAAALRSLAQERDTIRAKTIEECKRAIVGARFGAPSNWMRTGWPKGWHLDRPCTPQEASYHDNGCNDAFMAVSAIASKAECPEQPSEP